MLKLFATLLFAQVLLAAPLPNDAAEKAEIGIAASTGTSGGLASALSGGIVAVVPEVAPALTVGPVVAAAGGIVGAGMESGKQSMKNDPNTENNIGSIWSGAGAGLGGA